MKGLSPLVSYSLAALLAVAVVGAAAALVYSFYDTIIKDEIRRELTQVAAQASSKLTEVYATARESKAAAGPLPVVLAEARLDLPPQVALREYRLVLLSASQMSVIIENVTEEGGNVTYSSQPQTGKLIAETTQEPFVSVERDVPGLDVEIQGRTGSPAGATLRYYRYLQNGTSFDVIVMGDQSLVGQVSSMG